MYKREATGVVIGYLMSYRTKFYNVDIMSMNGCTAGYTVSEAIQYLKRSGHTYIMYYIDVDPTVGIVLNVLVPE